MTYEQIAKILDKNGVEYGRWTKGNMDRVYINNPRDIYMKGIGLEVEYCKTGNICYAALNGEEISHSEGRRQLLVSDGFDGKCWIDLKDGSVHTKCFAQNGDRLVKIVEDMLTEEPAAETQEPELPFSEILDRDIEDGKNTLLEFGEKSESIIESCTEKIRVLKEAGEDTAEMENDLEELKAVANEYRSYKGKEEGLAWFGRMCESKKYYHDLSVMKKGLEVQKGE